MGVTITWNNLSPMIDLGLMSVPTCTIECTYPDYNESGVTKKNRSAKYRLKII